MKRLIYILQEMHNYIKKIYSDVVYVVGQTNNPKKIKFCRDAIKNTFPNIKETEGESSFNEGKNVFYYEF